MPHVVIVTSLCDEFTGGLSRIDIAARDVRQMLDEMNTRFPGLGDFIDKRMAIIIDGETLHGWTAPLKAESEVYLVPRIAGG